MLSNVSYELANSCFKFLLGLPEGELGISIEVSIDDISELEELPTPWYPQKTEHGTVIITWYWEDEEMYRLVRDFIVTNIPRVDSIRNNDNRRTYRIGATESLLFDKKQQKIVHYSKQPVSWLIEMSKCDFDL